MYVLYYMENGLPALCRTNNIYYYDQEIVISIDGDTSYCLAAPCTDELYYKELINELCNSSGVVYISEKLKFRNICLF